MKKKIVSLILAMSIITSMATVALATGHDNPKSSRIVLPLEKINIK